MRHIHTNRSFQPAATFPLAAHISIITIILFTMAPTPAAAQASQRTAVDALFIPIDIGQFAGPLPELPDSRTSPTTTVRSRLVRILGARLAAAHARITVARDTHAANPATLLLNLFDDVLLTAMLERATPTATGSGYALSGRLVGANPDDRGAFTLAVYDDSIIGTVQAQSATYIIQPLGNGVHVVNHVDTSLLPPLAPPLVPPAIATSEPGSTEATTDRPRLVADSASDSAWIDVAVFYTPAARANVSGLTGTVGITGLVDLMFANANAAYETSGAMQRIRLVHLGEVGYTESGDSETDLTRLSGTSDGFLDEVHPLRDRYAADLVHLIADNDDVCGIAHLSAGSHTAFSLTGWNCEVDLYAFAHELGHNMGLNHDRYTEWCTGQLAGRPGTCGNAIRNRPHAYSYGYVNQHAFDGNATPQSAWRTIMAYNWQCRDAGLTAVGGRYCRALRNFSNPAMEMDGAPLGVPGSSPTQEISGPSDAVRTLNQTWATIAAFRGPTTPSSPDLAVYSLAVSAPTLMAGHVFTVAATVRNEGGRRTGASTLTYYRGERHPLELFTRYTAIHSAPLGPLSPGEVAFVEQPLTAPAASTSPYFYRACVATEGGDGLESNDCSVTGPLWVRDDEAPDLVVRSPVASKSVLAPRESFTFSVTVRNDGGVPSPTTTVMYFQRPYGRQAWSNVGADAVDALGASGDLRESRKAIPLTAAFSTGAYEYRACVATVSGEANTRNNCSGAARVTVAQGSAATDRAALVALYDAAGGANWVVNSNWMTDAPVADWFGVTTDESGRVTGLDLRGNGLRGYIAPELGNLASLQTLLLSACFPARGCSRGLNDLSGPIPSELGRLASLVLLWLDGNRLTGEIPKELGGLANLRRLRLQDNALTGTVPDDLANLRGLEALNLTNLWGLSGSLPTGLRGSRLRRLRTFGTQTCAPPAWREWLATIDFNGWLCGAAGDVTIDVAIFYTPAARAEQGGTQEMGALVDLMVARANQIYRDSGLGQRLRLVHTSEVTYDETGDGALDLGRIANPNDGYMDSVHGLRDSVGADLVHLVVGDAEDLSGIAQLGGAFSLSTHESSFVFTHELGHNMGLQHDRYTVESFGGRPGTHPAYGYVNQRAFRTGAERSSQWITVMAYLTQCFDAGITCFGVGRFSNPQQEIEGDRVGIPFGGGGAGPNGPADAVAVLGATGPGVALWREGSSDPNNRPPQVVRSPGDRTVRLETNAELDMSRVFLDPDGDALRYTVSSLAPHVVAVLAAGSRVTLTGVGVGTATIRATATDPGGLSATLSFTVTVVASNRPPEPVGRLAPLTIGVGGPAATVEVSSAFRDPEGDRLTYGARSSAPAVASAEAVGSVVTVTPLAAGSATVTVTATDAEGSNSTATQTFAVMVSGPADRAALEALYDATGGAGWTNRTNWKTSAPLGAWHGVTTDAAGRVTALNLSENRLTGPIPPALEGLANLEELYLYDNALTGPVPAWLGNLARLRWLDLGSNALAGSIPRALAGLTNLEALYLYDNALTGPVPASLGNLARLRWLNLGGNALTGTIPSALGDLVNLEGLYLWGNELTGPVPRAVAGLTNLEGLYLQDNALTGPVPAWLGNLARLRWLSLSRNDLTGPIPSALGDLVNLERLYLWGNELTGPVPRALAGLTNLEELYLQDNALTGPVPAWLGNLARLRWLSLSRNDLTGPIPDALGKLARLRRLNLWGNALTGPIPGALGNLAKLEGMYLNGNRLTGPIPGALGNLARLEQLDLHDNALTGPVPDALGNLASLERLYLKSNSLAGPLPLALSRLSRLTYLNIEETGLCAPIDASFQAWLAAIEFQGVTCDANRPPEPVGALPRLKLELGGPPATVEVSGAFRDPDDDPLTYGTTSSAPSVARVSVLGSTVTVAPVAAGSASVTVTATDVDGSNSTATQTFAVAVLRPFTDHPLVPGVTPVKAVHFTELRSRIDALRAGTGLGRIAWTDPVLLAGVTPVKLVHLTELRSALAEAYRAAGRAVPRWTDASPAAGSTPIRAAHVTELRGAILLLE